MSHSSTERVISNMASNQKQQNNTFSDFHPLKLNSIFRYFTGSTFYQGPQTSILQETQVQVVSTQDCAKSYKQFFQTQIFDERIICAGSAGHDTCQGNKNSTNFLYINIPHLHNIGVNIKPYVIYYMNR